MVSPAPVPPPARPFNGAVLRPGLVLLAQTSPTAKSGAYTAEQATAGEAAYKADCASCHGEKLEGSGRQIPPLTGEEFLSAWSPQSVGDLFERVQETMPADRPGQRVIQEIFQRSRSPQLRGRVFILEDYDIRVGRYLVQGVDVWLNNPRRPLEASGTSGMKAAQNGVPNISVLDGWWDEGYLGDNGWAITPHGPGFDPERLRRRNPEMCIACHGRAIPTRGTR